MIKEKKEGVIENWGMAIKMLQQASYHIFLNFINKDSKLLKTRSLMHMQIKIQYVFPSHINESLNR